MKVPSETERAWGEQDDMVMDVFDSNNINECFCLTSHFIIYDSE